MTTRPAQTPSRGWGGSETVRAGGRHAVGEMRERAGWRADDAGGRQPAADCGYWGTWRVERLCVLCCDRVTVTDIFTPLTMLASERRHLYCLLRSTATPAGSGPGRRGWRRGAAPS